MLLAVDIGNTSTKFALFDAESLVTRFEVPTHSDDLVGDIDGRLDGSFDTAIACSVVPDAAERLERLITHGFGSKLTFVKNEMDLGLKVLHEPVATLGTDRLVNSFAAAEKYGVPVVVCSFGTATTIDVVNEKRELLGGMIAPGMAMMAKALHQNTAKLPPVDVSEPDLLLGTNTEDAIRSGVFLSVVGLADVAIEKARDQIGDATVIATGGFAPMIAGTSGSIDIVDETLTLDGLRLIAERLKLRAGQ